MHLIYLRSDQLILSKRRYSDWRQIAEEYYDYTTSMGPWTEEEIVQFFTEDLGDDDKFWPFSRTAIHEFMLSQHMDLKSSG